MQIFKNLLLAGILFFSIISCEKDEEIEPTPVEEEEDEQVIEEDHFDGPEYSDDYTSIAAWSQRGSWNLANVHDPTVVKDGDYYYMYQTDASYGNAHDGHGHYPYRRSKDLVNWDFQGMAFNEAPAWVKDSLNNMRAEEGLNPIENPAYGFWAPAIQKAGDKFRLYYSVVVTNPIVGTDPNTSWTERAFVGLAESTDLASNQWEDKGMVVSSEPDGKETYYRSSGNDWSGYFKFNAIDPSYIITPEGEHWLIYGSWHSGIAAVQLNPETGKPDKWETEEDFGVRVAGRGNVNTNRWQALEGPEIIYNEETGYYYLFLAYDELSVAYNTRVARSESITGPYFGIDGANVTNGAECYPIITHPYKFSGHHGWVGFSHCTVFQNDETGQWYYSSQARLPRDIPGINASNAIMMGHVKEIEWTSDGWPVVMPERYAGVPEEAPEESEIIGTYEVITLKYEYQTMQLPKNLYIKEDGTATGAISGSWSYDPGTKILTIGNQELIIEKGWDWEDSPSHTTPIFSGINSQGQSLWGKKTD